jgi:hypothetical protein
MDTYCIMIVARDLFGLEDNRLNMIRCEIERQRIQRKA